MRVSQGPGHTPQRAKKARSRAQTRPIRQATLTYDHPRSLEKAKRSWRWYSYDPGTLRFIDRRFRLCRDASFAFVEQRTPEEDIEGRVLGEGSSLLDDIANDQLPDVSWIDPNFTDLHLFPHSNDDHPPADVSGGQELVLNIYRALVSRPSVWAKSLFVIAYDEHGGLYDHVSPPEAPDDDPRFRRYGVRVPALVVSPWSAKAFVSDQLFDHTSIIKTILLRFCAKDGTIPNMGRRVTEANDLSGLLSADTLRDPQALAEKVAGHSRRADSSPTAASTSRGGARTAHQARRPSGRGDPRGAEAAPETAFCRAAVRATVPAPAAGQAVTAPIADPSVGTALGLGWQMVELHLSASPKPGQAPPRSP